MRRPGSAAGLLEGVLEGIDAITQVAPCGEDFKLIEAGAPSTPIPATA